ncbi:uncharacterized protein LOC106655193 [Trichogramma pretiosum]|uniref:uncharacterized protein LOC106655193 n=1 Tax=Trichogramma pretiosum TaxID=7493 RepID=UPI0006C95133|nr:uncharacterized protein LOC106655193 [Trichogramma pretiosum]
MFGSKSTVALLVLAFVASTYGLHFYEEGMPISSEEANRRHLTLSKSNNTFTTTADSGFGVTTTEGYKIHYYKAQSVYGEFTVVSGGVGHNSISFEYKNPSGKEDKFLVNVEASADIDKIWPSSPRKMRTIQ